MTSKERAYLRALANTMDPILHIGKEGVTQNVAQQAWDALEARELIKVTPSRCSASGRSSSCIGKRENRRTCWTGWNRAGRGRRGCCAEKGAMGGRRDGPRGRPRSRAREHRGGTPRRTGVAGRKRSAARGTKARKLGLARFHTRAKGPPAAKGSAFGIRRGH